MMGAADIRERNHSAGQSEDNCELSQEIQQLNKEWRAKRDSYRNSQKIDAAKLASATNTPVETMELGDNGLAEAAASGRFTDCRRILQYTGPNVRAKDGTTPLCAAALWGQPETLQLLLDASADPGQTNLNGHRPTALHAAALQEHGKICMILLNKGADPYAKDSAGVTPIDYASCTEALWPHFAAFGCPRTSKEDLINKGVIRKASSALEVELESSSYGYGSRVLDGTDGKSNMGLLPDFSRPGSAYVVTAHHPPRPGSAAVPNYSSAGVSGYGYASRLGARTPGSRRGSAPAIDILAEGDESTDFLGKENLITSNAQSFKKTVAGHDMAVGSLQTLGL
jgi:hypothetical protein